MQGNENSTFPMSFFRVFCVYVCISIVIYIVFKARDDLTESEGYMSRELTAKTKLVDLYKV